MDIESLSGHNSPKSFASDPPTTLSLRQRDSTDSINTTDPVLANPPCRRHSRVNCHRQTRGYFTEHTTPPPPDPGIELIRLSSVPSSIIEARREAANIISTCRAVLTMLELTRMRKARVGLQTWTVFWFRIYNSALAGNICCRVREIFPKLDKAFKITAGEVCDITFDIGNSIATAKTEEEIEHLLLQLETQITRCVKLRQIRTQMLLETLRNNFEKIPVDVADDLFDDLKRGVFALDRVGDYHPGDPVAEERDSKIDKPLSGEDYISRQPDLIERPGFTGEFQEALRRATATGDEMYAYQPTDRIADATDDPASDSGDTDMIDG